MVSQFDYMLILRFTNTGRDKILMHVLPVIEFGQNNNSRTVITCIGDLLLYYVTRGFDLVYSKSDGGGGDGGGGGGGGGVCVCVCACVLTGLQRQPL